MMTPVAKHGRSGCCISRSSLIHLQQHAVNEAPAEALDGEDAEQITKHVPPAVKK